MVLHATIYLALTCSQAALVYTTMSFARQPLKLHFREIGISRDEIRRDITLPGKPDNSYCGGKIPLGLLTATSVGDYLPLRLPLLSSLFPYSPISLRQDPFSPAGPPLWVCEVHNPGPAP